MFNKIAFVGIFVFFVIVFGANGWAEDYQERRMPPLVKSQPQIPKVPNVPNLPEIPEIPKIPEVPKVPPRYPDPSIAEVHRQLQSILQVHQTLQVQHQQELAEIQRITAKTRLHQEMLEALAEEERAEGELGAEDGIEGELRRQKIRVIRQEAQENQEALREIEEQAMKKDLEEEGGDQEPLPPEEPEKKGFWSWFAPRPRE